MSASEAGPACEAASGRAESGHLRSEFASHRDDGAGGRPLVAHIIHRLAVGGMENGLVNLINFMPADAFRHAIICMTTSSDFERRIQRSDVPVVALEKKPGQDPAAYRRLYRTLRTLRPAIVHSRTFGVLDTQVVAALARVPGRVHSEHGRNLKDPALTRVRRAMVRKAIHPLIHEFGAVSKDLHQWLIRDLHGPKGRAWQIYNGVDTGRFRPRGGPRPPLGSPGFVPEDGFVIGTVGRLEPVKDQLTLTRAFVRLVASDPTARRRARLVIVGDGSLRAGILDVLRQSESEELAWLPGERDNVAEILGGLDLFVLPSLGEGVSNTLLEAMATGLPLLVTRVGGNPELVDDTVGSIVAPDDPEAMAQIMQTYLHDPARCVSEGAAARRKALDHFSMESMVGGYIHLYQRAIAGRIGS